MEDKNIKTAGQEPETPAMRIKVGEMTYLVRAHFDPEGKETLQAKIERMLRDEVRHAGMIEEKVPI